VPDTGLPEAGGDVGNPVSFTNPIQVDVSSLLNANTVLTTASGGVPVQSMDGNGSSLNDDFATQSYFTKHLNSTTGIGLPDTGFFPSIGPTIPNVQLGWNDNVNALNTVLVSSTAQTKFTFNVPPGKYIQLQVYATGAGGASTLNYTLSYTDGTSSSPAQPLPDWCVGTTGNGQYVLTTVDRVENTNSINAPPVCNIYAIDLNPDSGRNLQQVTFWNVALGTSPTYMVFYGATAW
jgi:hypothetical protein